MKPEDYPQGIKEVIIKMKLHFLREGFEYVDSNDRELPPLPTFKDKEQKFMFYQYLDWYLESKVNINEMKESIQDAIAEEAFENANGIQILVTYINEIKQL